eukprot:435995-Amphidinium_carterae.1
MSTTMCTQKTYGHAGHLVGHPWGETGDMACRSPPQTPQGGDGKFASDTRSMPTTMWSMGTKRPKCSPSCMRQVLQEHMSTSACSRPHFCSDGVNDSKSSQFSLLTGGAKRHQNKKPGATKPTSGVKSGAASSSQQQQHQMQQASLTPAAKTMPKSNQAMSPTHTQTAQPQPAAAPRDLVRPDPFGPLFAQVQAFPPDALAKIIELTASYATEFQDRKAYEKLILDDPEDMDHFDFLKEGHLYNEYYLAVAAWTELRRHRQAAGDHTQQSVTQVIQPSHGSHTAEQSTSSVQGPTRKAPPPPRNRASLEQAVRAVNKRRRTLAPQSEAPVTASTTAMASTSSDGIVVCQPSQGNRAAHPADKAMPKPKAVLVPAPTDPWATYPQPWTKDPRAEGGTLKLPTTFMPRLARYAKQVVAPIAALLNIRAVSYTHLRAHETEADL